MDLAALWLALALRFALSIALYSPVIAIGFALPRLPLWQATKGSIKNMLMILLFLNLVSTAVWVGLITPSIVTIFAPGPIGNFLASVVWAINVLRLKRKSLYIPTKYVNLARNLFTAYLVLLFTIALFTLGRFVVPYESIEYSTGPEGKNVQEVTDVFVVNVDDTRILLLTDHGALISVMNDAVITRVPCETSESELPLLARILKDREDVVVSGPDPCDREIG